MFQDGDSRVLRLLGPGTCKPPSSCIHIQGSPCIPWPPAAGFGTALFSQNSLSHAWMTSPSVKTSTQQRPRPHPSDPRTSELWPKGVTHRAAKQGCFSLQNNQEAGSRLWVGQTLCYATRQTQGQIPIHLTPSTQLRVIWGH